MCPFLIKYTIKFCRKLIYLKIRSSPTIKKCRVCFALTLSLITKPLLPQLQSLQEGISRAFARRINAKSRTEVNQINKKELSRNTVHSNIDNAQCYFYYLPWVFFERIKALCNQDHADCQALSSSITPAMCGSRNKAFNGRNWALLIIRFQYTVR